MQRNLRYLQDGDPPPKAATPVMEPEEPDFVDEDPDAEFAQQKANADARDPLVASAPPAGYVTGAPESVSDAGGSLPTSGGGTGTAPAHATGTNYDALRVGKLAEKPFTLNVPDRESYSTPVIAADDSAYNPRAEAPPAGADMPTGALPAPVANRVIGRDTDLTGALKTAGQIASQQPIRPVPKWWERGAAAVLGGAAGYSNAARRAAPLDIKSITEPILYPGYDAKVASWQSRMNAANEQVQNLGQQVGAQYAGQKIQSEAQLKNAQAIAAMAHGEYWISRSEQERNQWKINPSTGELYNTISGAVAQRPPTAKDRQLTALALLGNDPDAQAKAAYYALNGKLPPPVAAKVPTEAGTALAIRAAGGVSGNPQIDALTPEAANRAIGLGKDRDPLADVARQALMDRQKQDDLDKLGTKQIDEENKIINQRAIGVRSIQNNTNLIGDAAKQAAIANLNAQATAQLQKIKDANRLSRMGRGMTGDAIADYQVTGFNPDGTPAYRLRPPAGGNPYTPPVAAPAATAAPLVNPYRHQAP